MMPTQASTEEARWIAVQNRDRSQERAFVFGVSSTGIYCRPSCPSKRPKRENVSFYESPAQAEDAGFRACFRCDPKSPLPPEGSLVNDIKAYIHEHLNERVTLDALADWTGLSPYHLQRTFKKATGLSPRQYHANCLASGSK
jgi:AraC family transcriptional regulator of adaptative response/methylated-DNA-[protein]-cysteine methyltransferase